MCLHSTLTSAKTSKKCYSIRSRHLISRIGDDTFITCRKRVTLYFILMVQGETLDKLSHSGGRSSAVKQEENMTAAV